MSERCNVPNSDPSTSILEGNGQMALSSDLVLPARGDGGKIQSNCSNASDKNDGERRTLMEALTDFPSGSDKKAIIWKYLKSKLMATYKPGSCIQCSICQCRLGYRPNQRYLPDKFISAAYVHMFNHTDIFPVVCNYCQHGVKPGKSAHPACTSSGFTNNTLPYNTELTELVDKCYGKSEPHPTTSRVSKLIQSISSGRHINSYPVVLRPNNPIQKTGLDFIWKYLKDKLITTYQPGLSIWCSICQCHLVYQRNQGLISIAYIHMFTHTHIRPFVCNYCEFGVESPGDMVEHLKCAHPECAHITTSNAFTNNALRYQTELAELVDKCYSKSGPIFINLNDDQCSVRTLREDCQRTILEYLKPNCALDCSYCGAVLSKLWILVPMGSNSQLTAVTFTAPAAFEHVLEHCHFLTFKCPHCPLMSNDYVSVKRHIQSIHKRTLNHGIHFMETPLCYEGIGKMIDQCFSKSLKDAKGLNALEEIPAAKKRRLLQPISVFDIGVSSIPSTHKPLAALEHGTSELSPDQAVFENDQESKMCPVTTRSIDSGISSEIALNAGSSIASGNGGFSGWNVVVKCEVIDSTPVLIPTDQWVLKEPKKEEPEFD